MTKMYSLEPANFNDYRDFLKYRYENIKRDSSRYSLAACARRAKISKSLLQFILKKQRHLALDRMPSLAKALKMTPDEEYFTYLLVCKNSSQNAAIQDHFEKILDRIRHEYVNVGPAEPERSTKNEKQLYLNSLFMILQAMVRLPDFREDISWIKANLLFPDLTEDKIEKGLEDLEKLRFIWRGEDGKLQAHKDALFRPDPYDPDGQRIFTKGAADIAELMRTPKVYRPSVYMTMSLGLDEENLLKAEKLMIEVHHQLSALASMSLHPTSVVQVGNFLMTLVRLKS